MGILISVTSNGLQHGLGNHTEHITELELLRDAIEVQNREKASMQGEGERGTGVFVYIISSLQTINPSDRY